MKANIYNFFDRAIPEFLKKGDLVYHQPTTTVMEDNVVLAAASITGKKLIVDQSTETLLEFIKAYYEFLEEKTLGHDVIKNWNEYRDVDTRLIHENTDYFLNRFKSQYLPHIPSLINTSFLVPTKLDVLYYKKEYLAHLLSLSGQKRYDRFKKVLSDYQIKEIVDELANQKDEKKRILYVFTDFNEDLRDSRIVASCHLAIDLQKGIAEAAISIEDGLESKKMIRQFIVYCLQTLKDYSSYLESFYVNYMSDDETINQYGKVIGSTNSIYLIENDSRFLEFNLFDNDQTYELYYEADITKTYKVLFNFETNTNIVLNYEFIDKIPENYRIISKEKENKIKETTLDGGASYDTAINRIHGFTSNVKVYPDVMNGGASFELKYSDTIKIPKTHHKIIILGETYYIQSLDVMDERWLVDETIHHSDLTSTVRFFNDLPIDLKEFPSVYFTDGTFQVGPIGVFDVEASAFKVKSYELVNHFIPQQKLFAIFNKPIKFLRLKATVMNDITFNMQITKSRGVFLFDKKAIVLFPNETEQFSLQTQVDPTGYFVENSNYDKLPNNYNINYEFLIKHIKEFYLKRGSKPTYEFLFKLLFNENIDLFVPKVNMLIASDANFTKEHVLFAKNIFDWSNMNVDTEDCLLYGLSKDNQIVCYGQILSANEMSVQYDIEIPKFEILRINIHNHRNDASQSFFRVIISGDERMENYIGGKVGVIIENAFPNMFNGYFIGNVESRTEILIYSYHTANKWYDDYEFGGFLKIDDRLYLPEHFVCFTSMMEFLEINYDKLRNYAVIDQKNQITYFPIKIKAKNLVDPTLLLDDNFQGQMIHVLSEELETLTVAQVMKFVPERNLNISTDMFFYLFLRIDDVFTSFKDVFAIRIFVDKYNTITEEIYKDCELLAETISGNTFEEEHWKKFKYSEEDRLPIYDNHGAESSSATISSINEITKKITKLSFESSLPNHRYRTYHYDSQQAIDKDFERIAFNVSLDSILVEIDDRIITETGIIIKTVEPMDSVIIGTFVDFNIKGNGMPTIVDLLHSDIDEVNYASLNCHRATHLPKYDKIVDLKRPVNNPHIEDMTLTGFIVDEYTVQFKNIATRQIFFRGDYMTYDEVLVDENGRAIEGWCRAFFSEKAYLAMSNIFIDKILKPLHEKNYKDKAIFETWESFGTFMKSEENFDELYQATLPYRKLISDYVKTWKTLQFGVPRNIDDKVYLFYDSNYLMTTDYLTHIYELVYDYVYIYNQEKKFPIVVDNNLYKRLEIFTLDPSPYIAYGHEQTQYILEEEGGPIAFSSQYGIGKTNFNFFRYGPFIKAITNDYEKEIKVNYLRIYTQTKTATRMFNKYINTSGLNRSHLQDNFYYQAFSYEVGTDLPIDRYKVILNGLLHSLGTKMFGRMTVFNHQNLIELKHASGSILTATIRNSDFPALSEENKAIFADERYFISYDDEYTEINYG